ncbi:MAG: hypothetical protein AAFS01_00475 [Pseudomonadota bacterium]
MTALANPAAAQCFMCDEVVKIDQHGRECFLSRFDAYKAQVESGDAFIEVDIQCAGGSTNANRGGVTVMPTLGARTVARSLYTLDKTFLFCLRDLVAEIETPIDPFVEFDLAAQCQE